MYKRSIFVINPRFQLKFSFFICTMIILCSAMYPLSIVEFSNMLLSDPNLDLPQNFEENRNSLLITLIGIQALFMGLAFIFGIFLSHKIAGPMYKLQNYLRSICEGKEIRPLFFRKNDNFQEIAFEVNNVIDYFIEQRQNDFAYLDEVSAYISNLSLIVPEDKKPVLNEILSRLALIQSRYKED